MAMLNNQRVIIAMMFANWLSYFSEGLKHVETTNQKIGFPISNIFCLGSQRDTRIPNLFSKKWSSL